ncbi:MAG: hypothetical protein PHR16_11755 [Methylovulum sp.]|nr:hypothetical protein [Methylovulum sp.]
MTTATSTQSVPFGSGHVYVTLIRKADGTLLDPPQPLHLEGLQEATWDDKGTLKMSHGEGKYAVRMASGKNELSFNFTVNEISGQLLNHLCFGGDIENRQLKIYTDRNGFTVPGSSDQVVKILNKKLLNLARIDSSTSVTIGGVAATTSTLDVMPAGKYEYSAGNYRFSAADVGKTAVVTYDSDGNALVSTFKVPASLNWNAALHTRHKGITKGAGTGTKLTYKPWSQTAALPDVENYRASKNGLIMFNPSQTGTITVAHVTDGITVSTSIAALPAAGYDSYVDVGTSAPWVGNVAVELTTDSGTVMTGLTAGEFLVDSLLVAPATGEYQVDTMGKYTFAAADTGDTVTIHYEADFQFVEMSPPDEGEFTRDLGVRHIGGIALTRVALTTPLALENNQYAVSDNGVYYFDHTNGLDVLRINYQYELADTGQTIVVRNDPIGYAPTLSIDIAYELDGQMMAVSFERAKPTGVGVPTKQEDFAGMKFEMKGLVNRDTGVVYTVSTSA